MLGGVELLAGALQLTQPLIKLIGIQAKHGHGQTPFHVAMDVEAAKMQQ